MNIPRIGGVPTPGGMGIASHMWNVDSLQNQPGAMRRPDDITESDKKWRHVGSGISARRFVKATRWVKTTTDGLAWSDIQRRRIFSLRTGKLLDDRVFCDKDEKGLLRWIEGGDELGGEPLKNAIDAHNAMNPEFAKIYSRPRVNDEASADRCLGKMLKPGWGLVRQALIPEQENIGISATQRRRRR